MTKPELLEEMKQIIKLNVKAHRFKRLPLYSLSGVDQAADKIMNLLCDQIQDLVKPPVE